MGRKFARWLGVVGLWCITAPVASVMSYHEGDKGFWFVSVGTALIAVSFLRLTSEK